MEKALATHMNANIDLPMSAEILSSATDPMTLRKMMNMTVAMIEATVQKSALRKVRMAIGKPSQRV